MSSLAVLSACLALGAVWLDAGRGHLVRSALAMSPWLAIPGGVVVWLLAGFALYRILRGPDYLPDRPAAIRCIVALMASAIVWFWLFVSGRHPTLGLAASMVLVALAGLAAWRASAVDRTAGLSLVPALVAVLYVALLELSITIRTG